MSRARDLADAGSKANFLDNVSADINTTYAPKNNPTFTGSVTIDDHLNVASIRDEGGSIGAATIAPTTGIIQHSKIPAFSVVPDTDSGSLSASNEHLVEFDTALINNGNHFHTGSSGSYPYSFSAPVTGLYFFSVLIYFYHSNSVAARFQVDGTTKVVVYSGEFTNNVNPPFVSGSFLYPLTANEKVQIKIYPQDAGNIHTAGPNEETTMFSGFLVG